MHRVVLFILVIYLVACGSSHRDGPHKSSFTNNYYQQEMAAEAPMGQMDKRASSYERKGFTQQNVSHFQQAMIQYNGYVRLKVARPDQSSEQIVQLLEKYQGTLVRQTSSVLTIRVPKPVFREVFKSIIGLGEVLGQSISAEDVSAAFTDVELRLQTATAARERLLSLLERSSEKDKIAILRQLQRLNESIDTMKAQMSTLRNLAEMSRITIELTTGEATASIRAGDPKGFQWIAALSPFESRVCSAGDSFRPTVPAGFVALNKKGPLKAESADGALFRATSLDNNPKGNADFWLQALRERLAGSFKRATTSQVGRFQVLELVVDAPDPYIWVIAVTVEEGELLLVETLYPTKAQQQRHMPAVQKSLEVSNG